MAKKIKRTDELSRRVPIREKLLDVFKDVEKGFQDQRRRSDDLMDNWDAYNCKLGENQFYSGNSRIFVPIINDAVNARKTRFTNQCFPQSGRYVEVTTGDPDPPQGIMAILEYYVRRSKLRTEIVPAMFVNGDIEGQYTVYSGWRSTTRHTVTREQRPVMVDGLEVDAEIAEPVEEVVDDEIEDAGPYFELIPDADLLVLPATADSIDEALEMGGSVTIQRRWSKAAIKRMIQDDEIDKTAGEDMLESMTAIQQSKKVDTKKEQAKAAGIKAGGRHVVGYETWTKLKVDKEWRLCVVRYGGEDQILGCRLCPYWSDLCPVVSAPAEKVAGVFKGKAPVANVLDMQILANDTINEGADTSHFSAMPIIMTDPLKNPRIETMVFGLGAVWSTSPNDTQFAEFPDLWRDSLERAGAIKEQVFQSLGVNPSMIPQSTGGKVKRNQAEIANEQQVDMLTTADAVTIVEEGILTPLLLRMAWYDHQFREEDITIKQFGEMGMRANMERVEPIQMGRRFEFKWFGVESSRNAAKLQQQNAAMATLMKVPPQLFPEYEFNIAPLMVSMVEDVFGPRLAPQIFSKKSKISVDPEMENTMLLAGFDVKVHQADDDIQHMQVHMEILGDVIAGPKVREHLMRHQTQMQAKADAALKQVGGDPSVGGGGGPQAGAQPGQSRIKGPPGAIHQDRMPAAGAVQMPRKM